MNGDSGSLLASAAFPFMLAGSPQRDSLLRSTQRAVERRRRGGLEPFVKALEATDTGANGHVLIVVNELDLAALLAYCLTAAGFRIRLADKDVDDTLAVKRDVPDVVLLDSRLPNFWTTDLCREIRAIDAGQRPPAFLVFVGCGEIEPRFGVELGPCEFVRYPFGVRDLVLRVESLARSQREVSASAPMVRRRRRYLVGPLELDVDRHTALVNDIAVRLSPMEMRLLTHLVEHHERVCSRAELLADVWGYSSGVETRAADIHVKRLREKLGHAATLIVTIRGTGYSLSTDFPVVASP
jgi:two-component system phosphate regulon response regulator PhoB